MAPRNQGHAGLAIKTSINTPAADAASEVEMLLDRTRLIDSRVHVLLSRFEDKLQPVASPAAPIPSPGHQEPAGPPLFYSMANIQNETLIGLDLLEDLLNRARL